MKKVIYARYSSEKQSEGVSIEYQIEKIIQKFNLDANQIIFLIDKSYTGKNTNRPNYLKLLQLLQNEKIDLYAYKLDRLNRNIANQQQLLSLLQQSGSNLHLVDGECNINSASDEFVFNILSLLAQQESVNTSYRTKDALMTIHKQGRSIGGKPPLGVSVDEEGYYYYNKDISIVQEIYDLYYKDFYSAQEVRKEINQKYNRNISKNTIYTILENPIYQGYKVLHGVEVQVINVPMITREEFNKLKAKLEKVNQVCAKVKTKHSYLFKDKITINHKEVKLETKTKSNGNVYKYYRDKNKKFTYREDKIEKIINKTVNDVKTLPELKLKIIKQAQLGNYDEVIELSNQAKQEVSINLDKLTSININTRYDTLTFTYDDEEYKVKGFI